MSSDEPTLPWRPRWQTVLLLSNLLVLALPFAGASLFKLYDSLLVRQTEAELIVQAAALGAASLDRLESLADSTGADLSTYGRLSEARPDGQDDDFQPAIPGLDLARHPVLPPNPDALPGSPPDPLARALGRLIEPLLKQTQLTSLAGLRLVDAEGNVVASSGIELGENLLHRSEVAAAVHGYRASVLRSRTSDSPEPPPNSISRDAEWRVVVAFPLQRGDRVVGALVASRTPMSVRQALYRDRGYFVGGAMILLVAVSLMAWMLAAGLGRPLEQLIAQTERVRRGERGAAVPLKRPGTREVAQISQAVADMAATLERRADYISTFAANVSHELKTPLTSIQGTVELLRDHLTEMTPEELERFLVMLDKDSRRLERLVERLLELARADVVRPGSEKASLAPVVDALIERFRHDGVDVARDDGEAFDAQVRMATETLDSILSNLVDNARHHGGPDVAVRLRCRPLEHTVEIHVEDDGPGISPANQRRIFDRFFTTGRDQGRSGLGLSIVKALVEAHRGTVTVSSEPGRTLFVLTLPTAEPSSST